MRVRLTPRDVFKLLMRECDFLPQAEEAPEDAEYMSEWEPTHSHEPGGEGPDCAACWLADFDRAVDHQFGGQA